MTTRITQLRLKEILENSVEDGVWGMPIYITGDSNDMETPRLEITESEPQEHDVLAGVYTFDLTISHVSALSEDEESNSETHFATVDAVTKILRDYDALRDAAESNKLRCYAVQNLRVATSIEDSQRITTMVSEWIVTLKN